MTASTAARPHAATIRVAIVEDDAGVRAHLRTLINGDSRLRCVQAHSSGEAALAGIELECPDVVLMDIHLDGLSGIECVRRLRTEHPELSVVMLTAFEDDELIFQALKAGANGYILKQAPPAEWLAAVIDVHHGGAPMSGAIARKVVRWFHRHGPETNDPAGNLTGREREVLDLLAHGYLIKEIAEKLGISFFTVNTHVKKIYDKLQVRSRHQAVAKYRGF